MTTDIETTLRTSLAEHARHAPDGAALAERIIAAAPAAAPRPRTVGRSWRTWTLPLIAAGSVAAVVGAVVGVESYHPVAHHRAPVGGSVSAPAAVSGRPATGPSGRPATGPSGRPVAVRGLDGVQVADLTFVGARTGWALGTADCLSGPGTCTALLRTDDAGSSWAGVPGPPANVPDDSGRCADPCVEHVRFATSRIGYAFGPRALFMTTDAGATWTRQTGGAVELETLDGTVIRLVSRGDGCPGPCDLSFASAPVGSDRWTPWVFGRRVDSASVQLVRGPGVTAAAVSLGKAGSFLFVRLFLSTDAGRTWSTRADPCADVGTAAAGDQVVLLDLAAAADGSLTALCGNDHVHIGRVVTVTSTDGGTSFTAGRPADFGPGALATASSSTLVIVAGEKVWRSGDAGRNWRAVKAVGLPDNSVRFAGFEDGSTGHLLFADLDPTHPGRQVLWTTRDAGATWSVTAFS